MKSKTFEVPVSLISGFAELIAENDLDNEIIGNTDDGDIMVSISYEPEDRMKVFELMEWVDDNVENDEDD